MLIYFRATLIIGVRYYIFAEICSQMIMAVATMKAKYP
jgi:hypothetical protein